MSHAPIHLTQFSHGVLANVTDVSDRTAAHAEHEPELGVLANPYSNDDAPGDDAPGDDAPGDDAPGDDAPGDDAPGDDDNNE